MPPNMFSNNSLIHEFFQNNIKVKIIAISGIHLAALLYGIYRTIMDMILEEEPVNESEIFYILAHVIFQFALIICLFLGAKRGKALLALPWLIVALPVFVHLSYYTLVYSDIRGHKVQFLINILFIVTLWSIWCLILNFCRSGYCKYSGKTSGKINAKLEEKMSLL